MLSGDAAAGVDTRTHDRTHRVVHPRGLIRIVPVVRKVGMQVAVTGMKDIAHRDAVLDSDLANFPKHFGEARPWNHRVLHDEMRSHPAHRAECFFPSLPQPRTLGIVPCDYDVS